MVVRPILNESLFDRLSKSLKDSCLFHSMSINTLIKLVFTLLEKGSKATQNLLGTNTYGFFNYKCVSFEEVLPQ